MSKKLKLRIVFCPARNSSECSRYEVQKKIGLFEWKLLQSFGISDFQSNKVAYEHALYCMKNYPLKEQIPKKQKVVEIASYHINDKGGSNR